MAREHPGNAGRRATPLRWVAATVGLCEAALACGWGAELSACLVGDTAAPECFAQGEVALANMTWVGALLGIALGLVLAAGRRLGLEGGDRLAKWAPILLLPGPLVLLGLHVGSRPAAQSAGPRGDVVIIVIDTLRADRLDPDRTPALWRLVEQGIWFPDAWSVSSWTLPAFGSLLTGLPPEAHGLGVGQDGGDPSARIADRPDLLPRAWQADGRLAVGIVSNAMLSDGMGLEIGFDHFANLVTHNESFAYAMIDGVPYAPAPLQLARARWWLRASEGRSLFLLWHLMDPHVPYRPAGFHPAWLPGADPDPVASYDAEVARVDDAVGGMLALLERSGRMDDATIVLVSDHGEELVERRDPSGATTHDHGHTLYPETTRVPLVFRLPGGRGAGLRCAGPTTTRDLGATLRALGGLPPQAGDRSLLTTEPACAPPRDTVFAGIMLYGPDQASAVTAGSAVLYHHGSGEWTGFDRASDPDWRRPGPPAPELKDRLEAHEEERRQRVTGSRELRTAEALDALRALGYVEP